MLSYALSGDEEDWLVRELCSRVIVMRQGKIVEQGETREVLEYPKEEYTKLLMEYSL